jgi:hypothetical protein
MPRFNKADSDDSTLAAVKIVKSPGSPPPNEYSISYSSCISYPLESGL